jgi:hypothetical protein
MRSEKSSRGFPAHALEVPWSRHSGFRHLPIAQVEPLNGHGQHIKADKESYGSQSKPHDPTPRPKSVTVRYLVRNAGGRSALTNDLQFRFGERKGLGLIVFGHPDQPIPGHFTRRDQRKPPAESAEILRARHETNPLRPAAQRAMVRTVPHQRKLYWRDDAVQEDDSAFNARRRKPSRRAGPLSHARTPIRMRCQEQERFWQTTC